MANAKSNKDLGTLLDDINDLLSGKGDLPEEFTDVNHHFDFAKAAASAVVKAVRPYEDRVREPNVLYASELGTRCIKQLKYKRENPELAEGFSNANRVKFLYGGLVEGVVLLLAKLAGHKVEGEQDLLELVTPDGAKVRGRIDAIIDGRVIDVKSTTPYGFDKMHDKGDWEDTFGYKRQIHFYAATHPSNINRYPGLLLLLDKQSGRIGWSWDDDGWDLDTEKLARGVDILNGAVNLSWSHQQRLETVDHPKGNVLGTICSYCAFKKACWADSNGGHGLRAFSYYKGPLFFTEIKKKITNEEIPVQGGVPPEAEVPVEEQAKEISK